MSLRHPLESMLMRGWSHRGWLAWLLLPLAGLYRLLSWMHRCWFAWGLGTVEQAPVPLIVVGNVVVGGVGKTPVVMALVEHCQQRGWSVGVVSRGYGRNQDTAQLVTADMTAEAVGDEPLLLARRCNVPVAVAKERMEAVRLLMQSHPGTQVIVSDDGLQHHAMRHDVALCVFDDRGVGNGWPLPAGPLREAWPRTPWPGSVQFVLNTGSNPSIEGHHVTRYLAAQAFNARGDACPLSHWAHQPVSALAGIAHPDRFFAMLDKHGLVLSQRTALSDHASLPELVSALQQLPSGHDVLCTEKDAVKLWPAHPDVWAVPLVTELPPSLLKQIDAVLASRLSLPHGQQTP
jgi:tetraacyldisaccharide 4'-kinase